MNNKDEIEVLVDEFSNTFSDFLKKTKNIYKSVLEDITLTRPQIEVLRYLKCYGKSKMTDIGKDMLVTKSYITALVDKLIEAKLILREHDENDRRIIKISLTNEGIDFIGKYKTLMVKELKERMYLLSNEEKDEMKKMLDAMKNISSSKFFD